jgi:hypothetical protein
MFGKARAKNKAREFEMWLRRYKGGKEVICSGCY